MSGFTNFGGIINEGNVLALKAGLITKRPTFGIANRYYFATDENKIYLDTGTAWVLFIDGTGGGGTIDSIQPGDNIVVDNTDPNNPVVSLVPNVTTDSISVNSLIASVAAIFQGSITMNGITPPVASFLLIGINFDETVCIIDQSGLDIGGNSATATKLATARTINGVAFDGTANITITAVAAAGTLTGATLAANVLASSLTSVGTLSALTVTAAIVGSITGNSATATKLATARTINGVAFDGTANITITAVAAAGTLTGATLAANVLASSLTSVGVLGALNVQVPGSNVFFSNGSVTGNPNIAQFMGPNSVATGTAGSGPYILIGVNTSNQNAGVIQMQYIGNGNAGNYINFALLGTAGPFNIFKDRVSIGTTTQAGTANSLLVAGTVTANTSMVTATAALGTNTTQVATTAFVQANKSGVVASADLAANTVNITVFTYVVGAANEVLNCSCWVRINTITGTSALSVSVNYTDANNSTVYNKPFVNMGVLAASAALTTADASNFPVMGNLYCKSGSNVILTVTDVGVGTFNFDVSGTLVKLR